MKNEYKITKDLMISWANEYHLRGINIALFILWCIIGVYGLVSLGIFIFTHSHWLYIYISFLCLFVAVYKLFFSRFIILSNRYKMLSRTYGVTEWIRTTEFSDDEIILTDHNTVTKIRYENITKIKEKNNVVIIFLHDNMALRLYKDAFVEGSWQECRERIESKRL